MHFAGAKLTSCMVLLDRALCISAFLCLESSTADPAALPVSIVYGRNVKFLIAFLSHLAGSRVGRGI